MTDEEVDEILLLCERGFRLQAKRYDFPQSDVDDMLEIIEPHFKSLARGVDPMRVVISMGIEMLTFQKLAEAERRALVEALGDIVPLLPPPNKH